MKRRIRYRRSIGVPLALVNILLALSLSSHPKLNIKFTEEDSIPSVMEAIADETELDENYDVVFTNTDILKGKSLKGLIIHYNEAYQNERLDTCNEDLYQIGYFLLKQQIADTLGIEMNQIQDFSYTGIYIGEGAYQYKVTITYNKNGKTEIKDFILTHEGSRIAINLERARVGGFDTIEEVNECYTSFLEFMMTSGKVKGSDIVFQYDKDKQEAVKSKQL